MAGNMFDNTEPSIIENIIGEGRQTLASRETAGSRILADLDLQKLGDKSSQRFSLKSDLGLGKGKSVTWGLEGLGGYLGDLAKSHANVRGLKYKDDLHKSRVPYKSDLPSHQQVTGKSDFVVDSVFGEKSYSAMHAFLG
eukprot:708260-Pelagomonas_calceolata.AAC.1